MPENKRDYPVRRGKCFIYADNMSGPDRLHKDAADQRWAINAGASVAAPV